MPSLDDWILGATADPAAYDIPPASPIPDRTRRVYITGDAPPIDDQTPPGDADAERAFRANANASNMSIQPRYAPERPPAPAPDIPWAMGQIAAQERYNPDEGDANAALWRDPNVIAAARLRGPYNRNVPNSAFGDTWLTTTRTPDTSPAVYPTADPRFNITQADIDAGTNAALAVSGGGLGIKAYHGSPHSFDRFDLSKIGTGEGAQAYGHGLYFAENEGVARGYRDALSNSDLSVGGKSYNAKDPEHFAALTLHDYGSPEKAVRNLQDRIAQNSGINASWSQLAVDTDKDVLARIQRGGLPKVIETPHGHMYEVNINADPAQMLDWDKPLREQAIAGKVATLVPQDLRKPFDANVASGVSGANAYLNYIPSQSFAIRAHPGEHFGPSHATSFEEALAQVGGDTSRVRTILNPTKSGASSALNEAGIPGIKYLDAGSRSPQWQVQPVKVGYGSSATGPWATKQAGNPSVKYFDSENAARDFITAENEKNATRNYVVFNDKLIDILKRYGIAGLAPAGMGALAAQDQYGMPLER